MDSVRGDDSPARGARMSPARLGATYIFSGPAKTGASGHLEPEPNSLSPVRNLIFFVQDAGRPGSGPGGRMRRPGRSDRIPPAGLDLP